MGINSYKKTYISKLLKEYSPVLEVSWQFNNSPIINKERKEQIEFLNRIITPSLLSLFFNIYEERKIIYAKKEKNN